MAKHGCCADKACNDSTCMELPAGKTCGDCVQHTFNPWVGCTKVSPACDHCYAEGWAKRSGSVAWGGERRRTSLKNWGLPLKWERAAAIAAAGWRSGLELVDGDEAELLRRGFVKPRRPRVFCASLADVFDNQVPQLWRTSLFGLIHDTPHLDWLLLTKRIGNAATMLRDDRPEGLDMAALPNLWIGATVATQAEADRDIPKLLATPAAVRFLSIEPMLGPIDLRCIDVDGDHEIHPLTGTSECVDGEGAPAPDIPAIDWVICGGESGPGARPMHPDWPRSLRDQCAAAGVAFMFKQHGEWLGPADPIPGASMGDEMRRGTVQLLHAPGNPHGFFRRGDAFVRRVGKKAAGRLLDGRIHDGYPEVAR